jgi:hypothetical protein
MREVARRLTLGCNKAASETPRLNPQDPEMGIAVNVISTGRCLRPKHSGLALGESIVLKALLSQFKFSLGRVSVGNIYHLTHSRLGTGAGIGEKRSLCKRHVGAPSPCREPHLSSFSKLRNISRGGLRHLSLTFMVSFPHFRLADARPGHFQRNADFYSINWVCAAC